VLISDDLKLDYSESSAASRSAAAPCVRRCGWLDIGSLVLKVIVFGATGRVGRAVALTLLTKGHQVTAFARDASKLPEREEISAIVGDVTDADAVARAVVGHDAIVVALGDSRNPFALAVGMKRITPPNICEVGTANVIAAADAASIRRLVCVTSYGVGDTRDLLPPMHKKIFRWLRLREQMDDKEQQEKLVKASDLDWTLVQPVGLTDGAATGRWLASSKGERRKRTISRIDLAAFVVDTLSNARFSHETVVLSGLTITQSAEAA
jgi:putative NADH-flavin reductase